MTKPEFIHNTMNTIREEHDRQVQCKAESSPASSTISVLAGTTKTTAAGSAHSATMASTTPDSSSVSSGRAADGFYAASPNIVTAASVSDVQLPNSGSVGLRSSTSSIVDSPKQNVLRRSASLAESLRERLHDSMPTLASSVFGENANSSSVTVDTPPGSTTAVAGENASVLSVEAATASGKPHLERSVGSSASFGAASFSQSWVREMDMTLRVRFLHFSGFISVKLMSSCAPLPGHV